MNGDTTKNVHLGPSGSGLAWITTSHDAEHAPCVAVTIDLRDRDQDQYDPRLLYEQAKVRATPRISPHGAFRELKPGDHAGAIRFLTRFGPILFGSPATLSEAQAPAPFPTEAHALPLWVNLTDFWRRHRCYVAVVRVWEAFRDPMHKDLRSELREVVRIVDDFKMLDLDIKDALHLGISHADAVVLSDLAEAPMPSSAEIEDVPTSEPAAWIESASDSTLQELALEVIRKCLDFAGRDFKVCWQLERKPLPAGDDARMKTGNAIARRGVATFTMQLRADSLWSFLWLFFGLDTGDGIGWRVCPNHGRLFYPPRRDRYYCSADEQRRATKRESDERHPRAVRRK